MLANSAKKGFSNRGPINTQCRSPIEVKGRGEGAMHLVRCGQCSHCIIRKKRTLTGRILSEYVQAGTTGIFATFTLDDAHVGNANGYDWSRDQWRSYMQYISYVLERLRRVYPVRYFAAPDIGDRFQRPHAHVLLLGQELTARIESDIRKWYKKGFVDLRPMVAEHAAYTAGYVTKKIDAQAAYGAIPISHRSSRYWGRETMVVAARERAAEERLDPRPPSHITFDKKSFPLSRLQKVWFSAEYFKRKGYRETPDLSELFGGHAETPKSLIEARLLGSIEHVPTDKTRLIQLTGKKGSTLG